MLTFDFPKSVYELFLAEVPEPQRAQITQALSRQPFKITLGDEGPVVTIFRHSVQSTRCSACSVLSHFDTASTRLVAPTGSPDLADVP